MSRSNEWTEHLAEDRRLVVLRLLEEQAGYTVGESVLQVMLERFGHLIDRATLRGDLHWLSDAACVEVEIVSGRAWIVRLTARGAEVAAGRLRVVGIKRPSPVQ